MSKRFTDTEIWDKEWFMELSPKLKCAVRYVFDKCDVAGIWQPNLKLMSAYIGDQVSQDEILSIDGGKQFQKLPGGKIFIKDFVSFQYGQLSDKCKPHQKVISILKKYNLYIPFEYPLVRVQEKEEDKDKEKDKGGAGGNFDDVPEVNQIREELQTFFGVTEQTMPEQWKQIVYFATCIHHRKSFFHAGVNTLEHFWKQHKAYKLYKENNPTFNGYGLTNYLGTGPKYFMDGGWNKENWELKNRKSNSIQTPTKVKLGK